MDAFTGEVRAFAFGYVPQNWAMCYGQTYPIITYPALYSIIGPRYGGDGVTTFAVPNLQGQVAIGFGLSATSGTQYTIAQKGGTPTVTLQTAQTPNHTHTLNGATAVPPIPNTVAAPTPLSYLTNVVVKNTATTGTFGRAYAPSTATPLTVLNPQTIGVAGATQPVPHQNMMPYVTMTYCICLDGDVYPVKP